MEVWKNIEGFANYEVSSYGRVRRIEDLRILKITKGSLGLCKNDKQVRHSIRRLVATHFLPNPESLHWVTHRDWDTSNNNVENLEWSRSTKKVIGRKFGGKTIIKELEDSIHIIDGKPRHDKRVLVRCVCGKEYSNNYNHFTYSNSCGCLSGYYTKDHPDHKERKRLRSVFSGMKARCYNPKRKGYSRYGGRGIVICQEWLDSQCAFLDWAITNGSAKGLQIDRINNDGNYEPSNCRFVTNKENNNNRGNNITH